MAYKIINREHWLNNLASALAPTFQKSGKPLPQSLRLSCGFPSAGGKSKTIGECFYPEHSADAYTEIFIRPDQHQSMDVAAIVLHELSHAALGPGFGHGKEFRTLATAHGLEGKMRSTTPGPNAKLLLQPIIDKLGAYPHGALNYHQDRAAKPTAANPHKNLNCPQCGFHAKVLVSQMHFGRLVCPQDGDMLLMKDED